MNPLRTAVAVAVPFIALGAAGLALTPAAHGQARVAQAPRVMDVLGGSRIGVSIQDLEAVDAAAREGTTAGVFVAEVTPGSPAEQAGIRTGDLLVEFDGERVRSARQFTRLVQETPPGRTVPLVLVREGRETPLTVTPRAAERALFEGLEDLGGLVQDLRSRAIVSAPTRPVPPPPGLPDGLLGRASRLGLTLGSLSPQLAEYFGAAEGVLVTGVADGSVGQKMGVRAGDVITAVNEASVRTPADLRQRIQALNEGDRLTLSIVRDRKAQTLVGTIEGASPRRTVRTVA